MNDFKINKLKDIQASCSDQTTVLSQVIGDTKICIGDISEVNIKQLKINNKKKQLKDFSQINTLFLYNKGEHKKNSVQ